ncbi:MAG: hypothetical protein ACOC1F_12525 [Myxococcota bacterium]
MFVAADAFFENNRAGKLVPAMRRALDMVLVREPRPPAEIDAPFRVYVGGGRTQTRYLAEHPRPGYVAFSARLRDLAVGPAGERAGDVLLIANYAHEGDPKDRFYFGRTYHSWHGGPGREDSEIPLIVAHHRKSRDELANVVRGALGEHPRQQKVADLVIHLRFGGPSPTR